MTTTIDRSDIFDLGLQLAALGGLARSANRGDAGAADWLTSRSWPVSTEPGLRLDLVTETTPDGPRFSFTIAPLAA